MEYKFEEGDIVLYRKDNSFYKVVELVKTNNDINANNIDCYTISNDDKTIRFVMAKDLELP